MEAHLNSHAGLVKHSTLTLPLSPLFRVGLERTCRRVGRRQLRQDADPFRVPEPLRRGLEPAAAYHRVLRRKKNRHSPPARGGRRYENKTNRQRPTGDARARAITLPASSFSA